MSRGPQPRQAAKAPAVVFVVDDDPSVREALGSLFRSVDLQVELFGSTAEFLQHKRPDGACCLVHDIRLPGVSGLDFQAQLLQANIRIPIIFMTGHGDIPMSVRAMKAGAVDFLAKPFRDQDMIDAVLTAIERDRQQRAAGGSLSQIQQRFATLSARQQQVMLLVTAGKLNKQVAGDLGISEITTKIHRSVAMRKMGARTLADLVRMAEALKLKGP